MSLPIRFIHSADLHLDSLFKSKSYLPEKLLEKLRSSTFEAFDRLIDACIQYKVDFLLIAGDLYNEEMRSLKAQVHLRRGFERLGEQGIHVYISYGNHDYLNGANDPIAFPDHVHIFSSEQVEAKTFEKNGERLAHIYGFSYEERSVRDRKVEEYKRYGHPIYHLGMLHGSLETNTDHDVYAPFALGELKEAGMDYWALGHIHKREVLSESPPVIYPGNIQGRSRKEAGEKGCYLIELQRDEWKRTFVPLHSFIYDSVVMFCDQIDGPQELEQVLEEAKAMVEPCDSSVMLTVTLSSTAGNLRKWWVDGIVGEWVELLNESEDIDGRWIWIDQVKIDDRPAWDEEALMESHHFTGELLRDMNEVKEEDLEEWAAPLFRHRRVSKFVASLTFEEKKEAVEMAKTLTVEQLLGKEGKQS